MNNKFRVLWDEHEDEEFARIELTEGEWKDTVYHYVQVQINEDSAVSGKLTFSYDIDELPDGVEILEGDVKRFEQHIGDILISIIEEYLSVHENRAEDSKHPTV